MGGFYNKSIFIGIFILCSVRFHSYSGHFLSFVACI